MVRCVMVFTLLIENSVSLFGSIPRLNCKVIKIPEYLSTFNEMLVVDIIK